MRKLFVAVMVSLALTAPVPAEAQGLRGLRELIENAQQKNNSEKQAEARKKIEEALQKVKERLAAVLTRVRAKSDSEIIKKFEQALAEKELNKFAVTERARLIVRAQKGKGSPSLNSIARFGARVLNNYKILDAALVEIPADQIDKLAEHYEIVSMSVDAPVFKTSSHLATTTGAALAAQNYGVTGAGIGVAVIDSGIDNHADLPNVVKTVDFIGDGTPNTNAPKTDTFGHGTHVAGLIGSNDDTYGGVAPGVRLVDLRVLNHEGQGNTSDVMEALEWAILNRNANGTDGQPMNIRVINLSLGHSPYESAETDPLAMMVRAAVDAGIVVVVSAGNLGTVDGEIVYGGITSPGTEPSAITVGAMTTWDTDVRSDDTVGSYSSRGPTRFDEIVKPDIAAPGTRLVAPSAPGNALVTSYPQLAVGSDQMWLTGTSMAAPVVSGSAALMLQANPALNPNQLKAIMMYTAEAAGSNPLEVGGGYLNTAGAVNMASNVDATVATGDYWLLNMGLDLSYVNVIAGFPAVWSETIVWGKGLYETIHFDTNEQSYGQTIVWGKTIDWGDTTAETIVWGKTIAWGELDALTIVWGKTIAWGDLLDALTIVWGKTIVWDLF